MKSFASLILALALILTLTACAGTPSASVPPSAPESPAPSSTPPAESPSQSETVSSGAPEKTGKTLRVAALKGPTAMGMVKLMDDAANGVTARSEEHTSELQSH